MQQIQRIPLEGIFNTRDLGGIHTSDGHVIQTGRLIRSGNLYDMTVKDQQTLVDHHGLKAIIDFRTEAERAEKPDPAIGGVIHYDNPILEDMTAGITHDESSERLSLEEATLKMGDQGIDPAKYMMKMYEEIISSEFAQCQYRHFFALLLGQREGASLWHCSAGKDRVGIGTAMLLYALGVDMDTILEDYMMTGVFLKEEIDRIIDRLSHRIKDARAIKCLRACMGVDESYMRAVLSIMEETSGSIQGFLKEKIGLHGENVEKLKTLYLE